MSSGRAFNKAKANYGRVPEVLAEEIENAFRQLSHLDPEETLRLLKRYRKNRNAAIAKGGIHGTDFKAVDAGFSDPMDLVHIQRLDAAYQKLHASQSADGARRYVSNAVRDLVMADRQAVVGALGGRPEIDREEIRDCLEICISKHGTKKIMASSISWIIGLTIDAWQKSHASESKHPSNSTIRAFIKEALPEHPRVKNKKSKKPGC